MKSRKRRLSIGAMNRERKTVSLASVARILPFCILLCFLRTVDSFHVANHRPQIITKPSLLLTKHSNHHRKCPYQTISSTRRQSTALGSLVGAHDSWGNLATLSAVGVAAQKLGTTTKVGKLLGAPVTAMALTFWLASVGVLAPGGTATSRSLQGLAIQYATPWILLGANFGSRSESQTAGSSSSTLPLVFGFGLATLASLAGGWVGWRCTGNALINSALGNHDGLAIAAALLSKNIGGGINYVAVCAALNASPEAIATGLCIDNIGALVYFPISNLLASRYEDIQPDEAQPSTTAALATESTESPKMTAESISFAFFSASTLLWLGKFIANKLLDSPSAHIPVVTLLAVIIAGILGPNLPLKYTKWLPKGLKSTCDVLGTVCLFLFFTTAGAPGIRVAASMTSALVPLSVFSVLLYAIHGGILATLYKVGYPHGWKEAFTDESKSINRKWKRWRDIVAPQRLLVASSSAIGGPPTSVALARTVGWDSLVVPALLVGNIGYAISTFIGIAFYYCFKV